MQKRGRRAQAGGGGRSNLVVDYLVKKPKIIEIKELNFNISEV